MNVQDAPSTVTSSLVAESARLSFLPRYCGHLSFYIENHVYSAMIELTGGAYDGGYWDFHELSNGGFFMAPKQSTDVHLFCAGNGFDGSISPEAAGIVVTLFAISRVLGHFYNEGLIDRYYLLRDYALNHAESEQIFAAID
jgi:hypothetical protein